MKKAKATPKQKAKAKPKAGTKKAGTNKAVPVEAKAQAQKHRTIRGRLYQ